MTRQSKWLFSTLTLLAVAGMVRSQEKPKPSPDQSLVEEWFKRWNALDGSPETAAAVLDLFAADAMFQTGPNERQLGTVTYNGLDAIRKAVNDLAAGYQSISYVPQYFSHNEKSAQLFNRTEGPWGGASVAVEFRAAMTARATKKRFMTPGAAFFQLKDGKIWRLRFYANRDEGGEVHVP